MRGGHGVRTVKGAWVCGRRFRKDLLNDLAENSTRDEQYGYSANLMLVRVVWLDRFGLVLVNWEKIIAFSE